MPQSQALMRRPVMEWVVRGILATCVALIGSLSVSHTLSITTKGSVVEAHALAPHEGFVTARLAKSLLTPNSTQKNLGDVERLARLALWQDPTAVQAVTTLGLSAEIRGEKDRARRIFAYAGNLSRRDLQTQLWGIQDAVARNDIPGALRRYDLALRTSRLAPDLLFPVLASAISDTSIRTALIRTLGSNPSWSSNFIEYLASSGPDARATAALLRGARQAGAVVPEGASAAVIGGLIAGAFFDDAWSYYAYLRRSVDQRVSRDSRFTAEIVSPSLFDWVPVSDAGVASSIQRSQEGGVFDFSASPGVGGIVLQQMQFLPQGIYRLDGRSAAIKQPSDSRPYIALFCRNDGREIARIDVPNSAEGTTAFGGQFSVPAQCPTQVLTMTLRPSSSFSGVTGQLSQLGLQPIAMSSQMAKALQKITR